MAEGWTGCRGSFAAVEVLFFIGVPFLVVLVEGWAGCRGSFVAVEVRFFVDVAFLLAEAGAGIFSSVPLISGMRFVFVLCGILMKGEKYKMSFISEIGK